MLSLAGLRELAERLPQGAGLVLSREVLLEVLPAAADKPAMPPPDLTVCELGARLHRSPSTVRGWCAAGRFPGSYRLAGRDWRIPETSVAAFVAAEQARHQVPGVDLGAWRRRRGA
jgi:helix-turn-helix protein